MSTVAATNLKNASSATNNIVLNADGTTTITSPSNMIKSGTAQASTSGTAIDFTGLPSLVKRVTVIFNGVSTNGGSNLRVQVGAGSITSSGYVGAAANVQNANATNGTAYPGGGFDLINNGSTQILHGSVRIQNISGNIWVVDGVLSVSGVANGADMTGGTVTLAGVLDRVRITTVNGTDTFDAGTINILYEG